MPPKRLVLVAAAALTAVPACEWVKPAEPSAAISISVEPNPVVIRLACVPTQPPPEFCLASLDPTITVAETGGVGGRVETIELTVRNLASGAEETRLTLDATWIRARAGTDRLEAFGRLSFRPVVSDYRVRQASVSSLAFVIAVRFVDDHGHTINQSLQVGGA